MIVYRPNLGRRVLTRQYITRKVRYGEYSLITDKAEANELWDKEFDIANIPHDEGKMYELVSSVLFWCASDTLPFLLHNMQNTSVVARVATRPSPCSPVTSFPF